MFQKYVAIYVVWKLLFNGISRSLEKKDNKFENGKQKPESREWSEQSLGFTSKYFWRNNKSHKV